MEYRQLLSLYTDLTLLSLPPQPGERGGCMSSYDRASAYDATCDTYLHWDANEDGGGFIRQNADGSIVAFEQQGPGCIFRTWSALPEHGHIRIFIDDALEPVIDMPFFDLFEKQPGDIPPLNLSELSLRLSRGRNCWLPIPYQKYCRIELCEGWGAYYHFTYRAFPKGTVMPCLTDGFTTEGLMALAELDRRLYDRELDDMEATPFEAVLPAGQAGTLVALEGAGAIERLCFLPRAFGKSRDDALSGLQLQIFWDGSAEAAVDCPLGAFFGSDDQLSPYSSLPMSVHKELLTCRFVMPYSQGARVVLVNRTTTSLRVAGEVAVAACPDASSRLRFHALYHHGMTDGLTPADFAPGGQRFPDWPMLQAVGQGRFCGVHLCIDNRWNEPDAAPESWWYGKWDKKSIDWWWGEGDEKFFVDGEKFPSTFGTGSEDYIGYAWAAEPPFAKFQSPFAVMNRMPLTGNGVTCVSRFHIADNVPFFKQFQAFIEKYKQDSWGNGNCCLYACVPYWYQSEDTKGTPQA